MTRTAILALAALALVGCTSPFDDIFDDLEDEEFDQAAAKISEYCAQPNHLWLQRTRIEEWREMRQRGHSGPVKPRNAPPELDRKTAYGNGPVMMIWCEASTDGQGGPNLPPAEVWRVLVRDWHD